jgi:hypothetical protein
MKINTHKINNRKHNTRKNRSSKLCVVFDIDETMLVYLNHVNSNKNFNLLEPQYKKLFDYAEFQTGDARQFIIFRPGLIDFIRYAKRNRIVIAIWTYGDKKYSEFIDRLICKHYGFRKSPFLFVYSNSEIKEDIKAGLGEKDLRRIFDAYPGRFTSSNTFLVDNKPSNIYHETNMHNGFIVESFNPFFNRWLSKNEIILASRDGLFTILQKICNKIIKKNKVSETPIFGKENVQSMDLEKYYKQYSNKDKTISVLSTNKIDFDENFTLIK